MALDVALISFGETLGEVKRAFSEEYGIPIDDIEIIINSSNEVTIFPTTRLGGYIECHRERVDIDI